MSIKPIIFSAPMVRALQAGTKTQTRRLLTPVPPVWATFCQQPEMVNTQNQWVPSGLWRWSEPEQSPPRTLRSWPLDDNGEHYWLRLPNATGDRLYVREAWSHSGEGVWTIADAKMALNGRPMFRADHVGPAPLRWWPSIHMPRAFSRIWLTVTEVRVQRLQDINEQDAIAEGLGLCPDDFDGMDPRCWYRDLWDSLHGKPSTTWDANPWVVAYTFTVHKGNVDR